MGRPSGWVTAVTGWPAMRSPGRPGVNEHREVRRCSWLITVPSAMLNAANRLVMPLRA
ncbi:hypothetical protein [Micromonospora olivasterospora]|uniref:Uncharacterized protein n=1 Tax=Micromonospora olivasterospora TaxID=1880 RepID=A0A562IK73_MICOL|nr:hypothetical protein [Micromonospora olivasterospora]TWH69716.1 hypothetical protein JD77_04730 [Micromonospora olivasterospora]TWH71014.1 hypothetical protein JD77_06039 [Micromonospora olivasterospora]